MKFGLLHLFEDAQGRSERAFLAENVELVDFADQVGLDGVWLAEHHFSDYGVMPSTQVFASYLASRTRRVRIGTGVAVLPFHNPIRVAEEFAFIDLLSDGRLDFGVGRGYQPGEYAGYGIPFAEGTDRFRESLAIVRQAWETGKVTHAGKHFRFDGVTPRPRPFQRPHPPIFGASFNPETIKYQALQRLNLLFSILLAPPEPIAEYRRILRDQGEEPDAYRIGGLAFVYVDEDRERALRDFEAPCMWYFRTFSRLIPAARYPDGEGFYRGLHETLKAYVDLYDRGKLPFATMVDEGPFSHGFLVGTPEEVRTKLERLRASYEGMTDLLCWTRLGGLDHKRVMRSMELLVEKVVAPMRRDDAAASAAPRG
ncbi:MAG: LLM class flavin-dependent oxidoreductase [Myxococcales bacterium]|nr:LLM class flavin-dependent oxidoreductase [Myxococcales bacterium]